VSTKKPTPRSDLEQPTQLLETNEQQKLGSNELNVILPPPPTPEIITYYCATQGSRSVEEFECLNKIEEGAYGVVFRAKDKKSSN